MTQYPINLDCVNDTECPNAQTNQIQGWFSTENYPLNDNEDIQDELI